MDYRADFEIGLVVREKLLPVNQTLQTQNDQKCQLNEEEKCCEQGSERWICGVFKFRPCGNREPEMKQQLREWGVRAVAVVVEEKK